MKRKHAVITAILLSVAIVAAVAVLIEPIKLQVGKILPASQLLPGFYRVSQFIDGDTFVVDMNGHPETIRLIGIDTPETHKPNTPVQCFGPEASQFTKETIQNNGNNVRLVADPLDDNRDRYGRLLRYAYLPDGSLLEATLISQGYAFAYTSFPFQKKTDFEALQATATAKQRGLWTACEPSLVNGRWQSHYRAD